MKPVEEVFREVFTEKDCETAQLYIDTPYWPDRREGAKATILVNRWNGRPASFILDAEQSRRLGELLIEFSKREP